MAGDPITLLSARYDGGPLDLRLAARLFLPREPDPDWRAGAGGNPGLPGLIVGHGAGSRASRHEAFCLDAYRRGFAVLALDFRGHGASEGVADGPLELDIVAAASYLRNHPEVDSGRIYYRGSSMGGFYGLKAAPNADFAAMALVCPASEIQLHALFSSEEASAGPADTEASTLSESGAPPAGITPSDVPAARYDRQALRTYFDSQDSAALASRVTCPVLLVHARGDAQVPISHSLMLAGRLTTETLLLALPGGSHTTAQHDPRVTAYTTEWLLSKE